MIKFYTYDEASKILGYNSWPEDCCLSGSYGQCPAGCADERDCGGGIFLDVKNEQNLFSIEEDIVSWHKQTFPNATMEAKRKKLIEEAQELLAAALYGDINGALEEASDVFIVASAIAAEGGMSMTRFITEKMEVNRARKWGIEDENGDRPRTK